MAFLSFVLLEDHPETFDVVFDGGPVGHVVFFSGEGLQPKNVQVPNKEGLAQAI